MIVFISYSLVLILAGFLIAKSHREGDKFGLWLGVLVFAALFSALMIMVKEEVEQPVVVETCIDK